MSSDQGLSSYLIAPIAAWFIAQLLKFLLNMRSQKGRRWRLLYQSGNMPSAHTATLVALMTVIGVRDGTASGLFALSFVVTAIAAYDALMVRRSGGEQGLALRKLLEISPFHKDPMPYHALGHRPLEVVVGALIGTSIGIIVAIFITI